MPDPSRDALISICERALSAQITLDGLERAWPEPVGDARLGPLREALEDGIDHAPVGIDLRAWRTMPEYHDIEFYLARLREADD